MAGTCSLWYTYIRINANAYFACVFKSITECDACRLSVFILSTNTVTETWGGERLCACKLYRFNALRYSSVITTRVRSRDGRPAACINWPTQRIVYCKYRAWMTRASMIISHHNYAWRYKRYDVGSTGNMHSVNIHIQCNGLNGFSQGPWASACWEVLI